MAFKSDLLSTVCRWTSVRQHLLSLNPTSTSYPFKKQWMKFSLRITNSKPSIEPMVRRRNFNRKLTFFFLHRYYLGRHPLHYGRMEKLLKKKKSHHNMEFCNGKQIFLIDFQYDWQYIFVVQNFTTLLQDFEEYNASVTQSMHV